MADRKGIPNFINHWRRARGKTLEEIGASLAEPASKGTMSGIASGKSMPSITRLLDIATALKVSPGMLLDGPPKVPTVDELISMLETAQSELPVGVTLGGYPTAVASSLREQLLRYSGVRPNDDGSASETSLSPVASAQSRRSTKRSARG